uniref:Uncharacterized protein n=1 Tax=Glossina pallidipes TaxID=7398 RepID=A0A1B0AIE1_GLOPL
MYLLVASQKSAHTLLAVASSGQLWYQSIVQQFTREGYKRTRVRKASPIGDRLNTICTLRLHRLTKKAKTCKGEMSILRLPPWAASRTNSKISCFSSIAKASNLSLDPVSKMPATPQISENNVAA